MQATLAALPTLPGRPRAAGMSPVRGQQGSGPGAQVGAEVTPLLSEHRRWRVMERQEGRVEPVGPEGEGEVGREGGGAAAPPLDLPGRPGSPEAARGNSSVHCPRACCGLPRRPWTQQRLASSVRPRATRVRTAVHAHEGFHWAARGAFCPSVRLACWSESRQGTAHRACVRWGPRSPSTQPGSCRALGVRAALRAAGA